MATRKRTSSRSRINRAVKAGRTALRQAERRLPPDVRRGVEKAIKDGQSRFDATIKDVRTRVNKAAGQADVDRAIKRLRDLTKLVQTTAGNMAKAARGGSRSAASTASRTRRTATRRASTRKAATRTPAARKAATRKAAARKPAAPRTSRSSSTSRRAAPTASTPSTTTAARPATRRAAVRRAATTPSTMPEPTIRYVPPSMPEAPGPVPERVEWPGGSGS